MEADLYQRDFKCQGIDDNDINSKRSALGQYYIILDIIGSGCIYIF
jgi:hypothetical protein